MDVVRRGRATATVVHRCGASDIAGSSLRLPGLAEQHRWAIVAVAGTGRAPECLAGRQARGLDLGLDPKPGTGAERARNPGRRNGAGALDAVTFTLCVPEPLALASPAPGQLTVLTGMDRGIAVRSSA